MKNAQNCDRAGADQESNQNAALKSHDAQAGTRIVLCFRRKDDRPACLSFLVAGADSGKNLICGNGPAGVGLERIAGGYNVLAQPALHRRVSLFQGAQAGANHLTGRNVRSRLFS